MNNITKQDIINAIRRTAKDNGGKPVGKITFEKETAIKMYDVYNYWPRFGDAVKEAGFTPNKLQDAYSDDFMIEKVVGVMRKLNKFPTSNELRVEKNNDVEFPNRNSFGKFGSKQQLAMKIVDYCTNRKGYGEIVELCQPILEKNRVGEEIKDSQKKQELGEVYLFKSGRYYKIGKTNDLVRRGSEIRIQLPEKIELVHSIKTDDPNGIEAYWHRRFETKRMNGEWFNLDSSDIKAFKRWRRIG